MGTSRGFDPKNYRQFGQNEELGAILKPRISSRRPQASLRAPARTSKRDGPDDPLVDFYGLSGLDRGDGRGAARPALFLPGKVKRSWSYSLVKSLIY